MKNIKWANEEIKKERNLLNDKRYEREVDDLTTGVLLGLKKALTILDQLDEPEAKKIIDLEYELFLEKTKDSNNSFYWFTAKRTPLITDVSYMSKDNHFYGFKQVPNYHFIEKHDLRFITNCSLDDLIEQYR